MAEVEPLRRLLAKKKAQQEEAVLSTTEAVPAPAPAPATAEEPLLDGAMAMRAAAEAGFELTPEELALLETESAFAPAPAPGELVLPVLCIPGKRVTVPASCMPVLRACFVPHATSQVPAATACVQCALAAKAASYLHALCHFQRPSLSHSHFCS